MRKDIARMWVRALRSGDYTQCKDWERFTPHKGRVQHDPLGVLAELAEMGGDGQDILFHRAHASAHPGAEYISNWEALKNFAGLTKGVQFGRGTDGVVVETILKMNDEGKTFAEIADFLCTVYGLGVVEDDADSVE